MDRLLPLSDLLDLVSDFGGVRLRKAQSFVDDVKWLLALCHHSISSL
jgi:hypothetical protein